MAETSLDAALDELYGSDLGDFVATRKRLIAELRAAGDKGAAKELQGARRPSTAAGALNQLARRRPDLVEELLDRGSELQAAQTRAVSGRPDAMRDAMRAHRTALDAATDAALAILGSRANDGFRNEIVATLHTASADDDTGRLLRAGRVIQEAQFQGFPDVAGLTLVPELSATKRTASRKPAEADTTRTDRSQTVEADAKAKAKVEREREARRRASLAARDAARKQAAAADADATRAQSRIDKLQGELDVARRALDSARDRSRTATDEAARLEVEAKDGAAR
jgi:hypothetical protein